MNFNINFLTLKNYPVIIKTQRAYSVLFSTYSVLFSTYSVLFSSYSVLFNLIWSYSVLFGLIQSYSVSIRVIVSYHIFLGIILCYFDIINLIWRYSAFFSLIQCHSVFGLIWSSAKREERMSPKTEWHWIRLKKCRIPSNETDFVENNTKWFPIRDDETQWHEMIQNKNE